MDTLKGRSNSYVDDASNLRVPLLNKKQVSYVDAEPIDSFFEMRNNREISKTKVMVHTEESIDKKEDYVIIARELINMGF